MITDYTLATADLFTFDDDIAQQAGSSALVGKVRALGSLSRMKDQASLQRAILEAALISGQFAPGTLNALLAAQAQQATDLASFETSATLGETQVLNNTVAGPPVDLAQAHGAARDRARRQRRPAEPRPRRQPAVVCGHVLHRRPDAPGRTAARQRDRPGRPAPSTRARCGRSCSPPRVAAAVLIFVLLATLIIARSMVRPLRQLKAGALEVAEVRLPGEVRELSTAGGAGQAVGG